MGKKSIAKGKKGHVASRAAPEKRGEHHLSCAEIHSSPSSLFLWPLKRECDERRGSRVSDRLTNGQDTLNAVFAISALLFTLRHKNHS